MTTTENNGVKPKAPPEVIERIKKLERMASSKGGASEGEIANALRFIKDLRDKYDLEDADLRDRPDDVEIIEDVAMEWNRTMLWQENLGAALADLFDCQFFIHNRHKGWTKTGKQKIYKGMKFVGTARDVAVACQVYEVTYYTMRMMMRMRYGGGNWTVEHNSYASGMVQRLWDRIRQMKQEVAEATTAIVLCKDAIIKRYVHENMRVTRTKARTQMIDRAAQALGYEDGAKLDLTPSDRKTRQQPTRRLPS